MKKILFVFICGIAGLFLLLSCNSKRTGPIELEEYINSRDIPLLDTESFPSVTLSWTLQTPKASNNKQIKMFVENTLIHILCGDSCDAISIENAIDTYAENFQSNLKADNSYLEKENDDISKRLLELIDASFEEFKMNPAYNKNGFFSFTIIKNSYNGGAHGMNEETAYILDLKNLKQLGYSEILNNTESLKDMLIEQMFENYNVSKYEELYELGFFDLSEFFITENIALSPEGIMWIYNPYEIASYATGRVKIAIPFQKLHNFFTGNSPLHRIKE